MVKIPQTLDPTIEAMKEACKNRAKTEKRRNYLGASLIGNPCCRQIWYDYNGYDAEEFEATTLWNFEDGHRTEDLIASRLRMVDGIELWTHQENGEQFGFKDLGGRFAGHCDGVIRGLLQAPKRVHVWECKACGQKKFDEFLRCKEKWGDKETLKHWNENYYIQANLYMHFLNINRHYLTVSLAGGRDLVSCRTEYNDIVALGAIDKAEMILNSVNPPVRISNKSDFYICKMCRNKGICHNENSPSISTSCG